jgi:hypothetical protein
MKPFAVCSRGDVAVQARVPQRLSHRQGWATSAVPLPYSPVCRTMCDVISVFFFFCMWFWCNTITGLYCSIPTSQSLGPLQTTGFRV